MLLNLLKRD